MSQKTITVNRAPVHTLWAAVVAERLGFDEDTALSLGQAVAALNAQAKGRRLGIFERREKGPEEGRAEGPNEVLFVEVCGRAVPAIETGRGLRAFLGGRALRPDAVRKSLDRAFGPALAPARSAMKLLAESRAVAGLATEAYPLYEQFRPSVPEGRGGWGAKGELDLGRIRRLARRPDTRARKR
jgi:hypothetical protein